MLRCRSESGGLGYWLITTRVFWEWQTTRSRGQRPLSFTLFDRRDPSDLREIRHRGRRDGKKGLVRLGIRRGTAIYVVAPPVGIHTAPPARPFIITPPEVADRPSYCSYSPTRSLYSTFRTSRWLSLSRPSGILPVPEKENRQLVSDAVLATVDPNSIFCSCCA